MSLTLVVLALGVAAATAQSLPSPFADQDVGAVGLSGSATYSNGTFTVYGAGADIWGTADSFHFVNQILAGDGQTVARVASMTNTNTYAKAGVMIRESLTAGSRHVILDLKPGGGVEFMTRTATGGSTTFLAGGTGRWLKLVRKNGIFTASVSADGLAWTVIGSQAVTMATNVYVGLVVCSHNTGALNTSTFTNVSVQPAGTADAPPTVSITSPVNGATFAAGASVTVAATASDGDTSPVARVDVYAKTGTTTTLIGSDTTSPYSATWTNVPAGTYTLTAVATDTANKSTTSAAVSISVAASSGGALPTGWADEDIGAVGLSGSASYSNGTFTVRGAGADIWGSTDAFHFANLALGGDGQIVARVASMTNTNTYAKAGIMIRETLTAGSRHVLLDVKPGGGVEFMARSATGGSTSYLAGGTGPWLKLTRMSSTFTAYVSSDGVTWKMVGSAVVTMAPNVWVGLAVCSHNTGALNTATFDKVSVTSASSPALTVASPPSGATYTPGTRVVFSVLGATTPLVHLYVNDGTGYRIADEYIIGGSAYQPGIARVFLSPLPAGSYSAIARTDDGKESAPVRLIFSTATASEMAPTVSITGTATTVTATATDPDATPVARIELFATNYDVGDWSIGTSTTSSLTVPAPTGATALFAIVTDTAGVSTVTWY